MKYRFKRDEKLKKKVNENGEKVNRIDKENEKIKGKTKK